MVEPNKNEVEITEAVEVFANEPSRAGKKDLWVTYKYPDGRLYMLTMPAENVTEAEIERRIKLAEAARQKMIGRKVTIS